MGTARVVLPVGSAGDGHGLSTSSAGGVHGRGWAIADKPCLEAAGGRLQPPVGVHAAAGGRSAARRMRGSRDHAASHQSHHMWFRTAKANIKPKHRNKTTKIDHAPFDRIIRMPLFRLSVPLIKFPVRLLDRTRKQGHTRRQKHSAKAL